MSAGGGPEIVAVGAAMSPIILELGERLEGQLSGSDLCAIDTALDKMFEVGLNHGVAFTTWDVRRSHPAYLPPARSQPPADEWAELYGETAA